MPGPIYTAGRTPLTSGLNGAVGGNLKGPSQPAFKKLSSRITTQFVSASGSRTPPTFVAFTETTWVTGSVSKDMGVSLSWNTDDIIVIIAVSEDLSITVNTPTVTGLTFNAIGSPSSGSNQTWMHRWVATAGSSGSGTINVTSPSTSAWGAMAWQYRDSEGIGAAPVISSAVNVKTISVTETQSNSAILMALGDWGAGAVGSPTWTPSGQTQRVAANVPGLYSVMGANWADAGTADTTSYGLTAGLSNTENITKGAVEVLGKASGGAPEVFGTASLSIESAMTSTGTNEVLGFVTATVQSGLTSTGLVQTTGNAALTVQSNMTAAGVRAVLGTTALSIESNLSAAGSTSVAGVSAMSVQSSLVVTGSVTVRGAATLTAQSNVSTIGSNTVIGSTIQSIQSSLVTSGRATTAGIAAFSVQSNMANSGFATSFGISALSSSLVMVSEGIVGLLPPTATFNSDLVLTASAMVTVRAASVLSGQSNVTVVGSNNARAASVLSGQSNLIISGQVATQGVSVLSIQSNITTVGTTSTTPPSAVLSGQSNMTVIGSVNVRAAAVLSIQSNITVNSVLTIRGVTTLSVQSSIAIIGTRGVYGSSVLSVQSSMATVGNIPAIVTGSIQMTIESNMDADGNSAPPWVFPFIEFSKVTVVGVDRSKTIITWEGG